MSLTSIDYRGIERLVIAAGAILTIFWGYRLFSLGVTSGKHMECKTSFGRFVMGGTAPGIVFMSYGCWVLVEALLHGGAEWTKDAGREVMRTQQVELEAQVVKSAPPPRPKPVVERQVIKK